jgi:homoserine dehydrogenase
MPGIKKARIAIVGCGVVGGATAQYLATSEDILTTKTGLQLQLKYVIDKDFTNAKRLGLDEKLFCTDLGKALGDPEVDIVVELVGGINFAKQVIESALKAKKHVVTANKALLAHHQKELLALARANGVCLAFEASCGGGIPLIRAIYDGLMANRIDALYGIVNGTCNYILTSMTQKGLSFEEALSQAQKLGLAEADPTLDISGGDTAHKLTILASLAFARFVPWEAFPVSGIQNLDAYDVTTGGELGYTVKLLAIARRVGEKLSLMVRPAFISKTHPLAWVSGPFNAVSIYGDTVGHTMYYGRGAGGKPTASAIAGDIISIVNGSYAEVFNNNSIWQDTTAPASLASEDEFTARYYLRLMVEDKPGVLANVSAILSEQGIGISSVLQHEHSLDTEKGIPVVITTYKTVEGHVKEALAKIRKLPCSKSEPVCITILDEHAEYS